MSVSLIKVMIPGPCRLVYRPQEADKGDSSATVWIEVEGDVQAR